MNDTSRRKFLKSAAAAGASLPILSAGASAQNPGADIELQRLQSGRLILLKGGIVLTLDAQLGDFANADVLIENGKIREIRPNLAISPDAVVIDASNRIVIPGFVD